jgi:hypothetical protein
MHRRLAGAGASPAGASVSHFGRLSSSMASASARAAKNSPAGFKAVKGGAAAPKNNPPSGARAKSTTSPLEADAGTMGTKVHHTLAHSMGVLAPLYFFLPDSYTDGFVHKTMGVMLGANMGMHAWIGLNYVATDYVPKVSKALLGPSRYVAAGVAFTILLGTVKIAAFSPGGIKGVIKGVWNGKPKDKFDF